MEKEKMRSRSRQARHLTFHPIVIASAVVFVVLFLALGYHTGVNDVERAHRQKLSEVTHILEGQQILLKRCNKQLENFTKEDARSDSHVRTLRAALRELQKEQNEVQATYKGLDEQNNKCELDRAGMEMRLDALGTEAAQNRQKVEDTVKEVDALQVSIMHITRGEGMSVVLLNEVLNSLRASYESTCRNLPGCVVMTDEDLLKLRVEDNRTEDEIRAFLERDAAAQKSLVNSLQGSSANLAGIYFLPTVDEERQWDTKAHYPTYFKRNTLQRPLRGVKTNSSRVRTAGNVVKILETYSDYAMCAYRYNNPRFSFQSFFEYTPDDAAAVPGQTTRPLAAFLHKLIVSPLLLYCTQCDANMWRQQYRLACFKNRMSALHNYGTHDFWVVRSMIQAAPSVQTEALNFYASHEAEKQRVLAVVLHLASERDRQDCDRAAIEEYGIHYQYLTANFPRDAALQTHIADERGAQCSPTPAQVIEHIGRVRNTAAYPFDKVYLSVSAEMRSNMVALLKERGGAELLALLLPAYTNPQKEADTPGFAELVDLEIASRATDILVSPFMRASRYVTEEFLLRHKLNASGHVWVF
ncbi:hypothetical protein ABB37_00342 [Leptomonas pyrrhocoris]|uniref:Uncharacterized protein n=1 Tax=Leptomonas pyrrhocoris TaxID=157538 RepID=A0A0N0E063_LEPPY|nr:hypothetical protein ABB37_00342 [Leptomonas pyrrhocoris]KPA86075.1 hypothetical protein ABB37_00342 [Leptomonas pyrrhocoris]|eukprot:XP_015664514.1 hypothetical protein ABB37_00342 [Leptomonas pyrrhocoris]